MKRFYRILTIVFIIVASALKAGAILNTRLFNSKDIVSSGYSNLCLDRDGYLWIGTPYGLLRFDGCNFDKYLHDEKSDTSLSDNRIMKILCDVKGRLWVATCEGLNLYDPLSDSFRRISLPDKEHYGYIFDLLQTTSGDIVFMVSGVGPYILDFSSGNPTAVKFMPQIKKLEEVNTIAESTKGEIIGGTHSGDIVAVAPNGHVRSIHLADTYIKILTRDSDGNFFIATTTKAWRWNIADGSFTPVSISEPYNPVLDCATLTGDGKILVGTVGRGVFVLDRGSDELKPYRELTNPVIDISRARISAISEDPLGNLWLGSSHQGILMFPRSEITVNFVNISRAVPGYSGGRTTVAVSPASEAIWVGLDDGRLISVDEYGNRLSVFRLGGGITSMTTARSGNLYLGVDNHGLFEFSPATGNIRQLASVRGNYLASGVAEDPQGNVYLGIHGDGVIKYDPASGQYSWLLDNDGSRRFLWPSSLFCDSKGRIWIGMFGGLSVYDPSSGKSTNVSEMHPVMIKGVHLSMAEDRNGNIWDATSSGLYIIRPSDYSYRRLTTNEGLADNYVSNVIFDTSGNAWIGTHNGINRVDSGFNIVPFYGRNDMSDNDYFSSVISSDRSRLLFSGEKGVTILDPAKLSAPALPDRKIFISGIFLNNSKVNSTTLNGSGRNVISGVAANPEKIHLSYRDNSLALRLSTKDFRETDNIVFQWRVKGVADDWISTVPGSGMINLPHFQPGHYILEIRATENGAFSDITSVEISVTPPWYLSPWAKALYIILLCVLILLVIRLIRHKNDEKVNDEKIKFFINISHEVRSPLTLILSPLEHIMKKEHDPETTKNLNLIHRNANRILALINQLLDIRKIDKGKMKISCTETELVGFTSELVDIFKPQAEEKHLTLSFAGNCVSDEKVNVWIDRNNFDKVLVNLITNAIKYTPENGRIDVAVRSGRDSGFGDYAEISVTDTGIGLDEKNVDRLFDRFYQGKFNRGTTPLGFGIGLDLCKQLVELHHGVITAANRPDGRGSCFTVRIPLGHSHLAQDEIEDNDVAGASRNVMPRGAAVAAETPSKKSRRYSSLHILVADDDPEIRDYITDALSSFGRVTAVTNGREALRTVNETDIDIVISDIMMPETDGLTLLKTLKSNVSTNHIPVVLLSSKNETADRTAGWEKGADAYIAKPFSIAELQSIIDSLIDNRLRLRGKFSGAQQQDGKIDTPELKGNDKVLIDKIVQVINENLDDSGLNVERLCQEVGLSRAHLNRKMKELLGLTPSDFIRNIRLGKACELLRQPDVDISQIAYSIGFSSQPHFSTAFRRFTGLSPSEYRTKNGSQPAQQHK